jgi:hypothetical protein
MFHRIPVWRQTCSNFSTPWASKPVFAHPVTTLLGRRNAFIGRIWSSAFASRWFKLQEMTDLMAAPKESIILR